MVIAGKKNIAIIYKGKHGFAKPEGETTTANPPRTPGDQQMSSCASI